MMVGLIFVAPPTAFHLFIFSLNTILIFWLFYLFYENFYYILRKKTFKSEEIWGNQIVWGFSFFGPSNTAPNPPYSARRREAGEPETPTQQLRIAVIYRDYLLNPEPYARARGEHRRLVLDIACAGLSRMYARVRACTCVHVCTSCRGHFRLRHWHRGHYYVPTDAGTICLPRY